MKKLLSALLALMMLLACCAGLADEVNYDIGSGFDCTYDNFSMFFNLVASSAGYPFTFQSEPIASSGYDVYVGESEESYMTFYVFTKDGKVQLIAAECKGTMSNATKLGEWLGAALMSSAMALKYGETGNLTDDVVAAAQNDLNTYVQGISNAGSHSQEELKEGVVINGTACGYPTALELKIDGSDSSSSIYINMYIVSATGRIIIKD